MIKKRLSDVELMSILDVDEKTLKRFNEIRNETIEQAKKFGKKKTGKIKVLGISGSARDELDNAQEKSNSETLLEKCLEQCKKEGAEVEMIKLRNFKINHCKACYSTCNTQCHFYCSCYAKNTPLTDDMTTQLYDKILEADGIIFATPVNNYSMSTLMKTFIDRTISLDGSLSPANPKSPKDKALNIKHMKFIELTSDENIPGSGMLKRFNGKVAGVITTGHEEGASMVISSLFMYLNGAGMLFPPFSTMYAMSSYKNSTFEDKKITQGETYKEQAQMLGKNILLGINSLKTIKPFEWKYDHGIN